MFMIIGTGEGPRNIEIPCVLFETKQDAEDYISKIPWLECYYDDNVENPGDDDPYVSYRIPVELYDKPVPPNVLAILPRDIMNDKIIEIDKNNITYGQAAGFCFFTDYIDRHDRVYHYCLREIIFEKKLVSFGDETVSKRFEEK
jgi:hypothetical protein